MSGSSKGGIGTCCILIVMLVACSFATSPLVGLVAAVVAGLLAIELDRRGGLIATRVVRGASCLLPPSHRSDCADEWTDHVLCAGEEGLRPVLIALGIALVAAPRLVLRLRVRQGVGWYLIALLAVLLSSGSADKSRKLSWLQAAGLVLVMSALPLLALIEMLWRRTRMPNGIRYLVGALIVWATMMVTNSEGLWVQGLICEALFAPMFGFTLWVRANPAKLLRVGLRFVGVSEHDFVERVAAQKAAAPPE